MTVVNPFITQGYLSPRYFCDRVEETKYLTDLVINGNNVALISPRRLGKTGLICHCFEQQRIKDNYHTFIVDIYATKNLQELVFYLGKSILGTLKPQGRKVWERFVNALSSLRSSISFDINGMPEWGFSVGDVKVPQTTLEEIFMYLEQADKPCIVAIDEFQVIADYPEKNTEAILRTHIQRCKNTRFIYAGSRRHMMAEMFISPSRPFYQSTSMMSLAPINIDHYIEFAQGLFREYGKDIEQETIREVYQRYEGVTWYVQTILNTLFAITEPGGKCLTELIEAAIQQVITQQSFTYSALLYQLPSKQKEVLIAICKEGKATNITARPFLQRYHLTASTVQGAVKGLLEKDFITQDLGTYSVYDKFFAMWLMQQ
jgi:AAA+ ATPase superfamily predicted ATPase